MIMIFAWGRSRLLRRKCSDDSSTNLLLYTSMIHLSVDYVWFYKSDYSFVSLARGGQLSLTSRLFVGCASGCVSSIGLQVCSAIPMMLDWFLWHHFPSVIFFLLSCLRHLAVVSMLGVYVCQECLFHTRIPFFCHGSGELWWCSVTASFMAVGTGLIQRTLSFSIMMILRWSFSLAGVVCMEWCFCLWVLGCSTGYCDLSFHTRVLITFSSFRSRTSNGRCYAMVYVPAASVSMAFTFFTWFLWSSLRLRWVTVSVRVVYVCWQLCLYFCVCVFMKG